jgi:signal transduction histidine kinase
MNREKILQSLIPKGDQHRIEILKTLEILDTPSEETFRNLAETASLIFNASVAMISFVDIDRVFFKESFGNVMTGKSVKREKSLCSVIVLENKLIVFENLKDHPCHVIENDFINKAGLVFYAGSPIRFQGEAVGVLAVADYAAREFSEKDERVLANLAGLAADELLLRKISLDQVNKLLSTINDKTREIIFSKSALGKIQRELDNFLYRASHDLKGPLSSMAGLLNLAQQEITDMEALSYFHKLHLVSRNMDESLNKLTVIYTLLRENQYYPNVHLNKEAIEKTIDQLILHRQREIHNSDITVTVNVDHVSFYANSKYIEWILINLFENAIQFHRSSGNIKKRVWIHFINAGDVIQIIFKDNGQGIPFEYRSRVFELFFRGKNSSRSGMGLYIVSKLVEKLNGRVELDSKVGKYTQFLITIPKLSVTGSN